MEFVIPLNKDDLLQDHPGQYYVKQLIPKGCMNQVLDSTRQALEKKGPEFIFDHFDDFFSVIVHGKNVDINVTFRAYDRIIKSIGFLIGDLEKEMPDSKREKNLCITKMHCYLLSHLMCYLEGVTYDDDKNTPNRNIGRKKKKDNKKSETREEWEHRREGALLTIYRWLQLPLYNLWQSSIIEESFIMLLADICYKILEHDKNIREKDLKETIWQILGILVKRYMHGMTCKTKIIQLVRMYDALAPPLASGVIIMVTENDCPSFITEIFQEIEETNIEEAEARNIATFIETIASIQADFMLKNLDYILDYLEEDCYVMRNCAIDVIGHVIHKFMAEEKLNSGQKEQRDECLDRLIAHKLDVNTYVRSKVFQTWQKLIAEQAIPVSQIVPILRAITPHLKEKSSIMRKQTLQLLRVMLQCNPFSPTLDSEMIRKSRDIAEENLRELQANVVSESSCGDPERLALWEELLPQIQVAIKKILEEENDENRDNKLEEINLDEDFELIRRLIIDRQIIEAVNCLKRICDHLQDTFSFNEVQNDSKEYLYLLCLLKIFLDSEQNETEDRGKFNKTVWKKRKEKIQKYRQTFNMLDNAMAFVTGIEETIPAVEEMLFSTAPVVAIEACTLLGTAYQFNVKGAATVVHTALSQVFSREESVRNNVAVMYKEIYLKNDDVSDRQKAILSVNSLINLLKSLKPGQSPALAQLISLWFASEDLNEDVVQVMWEKYSFKFPETTVIESRCAVTLLTMVAQNRPKIIAMNLNAFIKVGLKEKGKEDLLLARDTCRALLKLQNESQDPMKEPIKFYNDHELFQELSALLVETFETANQKVFVSFATDAINVIYHLANQPDKLIKDILLKMLFDHTDPDVPISFLAKFLFFIGHVAIGYMAHLDVDAYKELKRRNEIRDTAKGKKKTKNRSGNSTMSSSPCTSTTEFSSARKAKRSIHRNNMSFQDDTEKDTLSGAVADDIEAEMINESLENCIVTGDGFLAKFAPLVIEVCQYPEKYKDITTQVWGVLALSKMMTVSSEFCKQNLQLLITILERSTYPAIRSNILVGLSDLMVRFPNEVEPWTAHMYNRLRDEDVSVRSTAFRVLSNLVKREIIRVKGQISDMALCIVDPDQQIKCDAESFFYELSQKDNVLYNILPDILSKLTSIDKNINEDDLHIILKHIMGLLHKEREIDALIDKICARFRLATTERQWRDLSYCLSLLPLGKKGIIRLTTNLPLLKDKLHNRQVYAALREIIEATKKKADAKDACVVLESEIDKLMDNDEINTENGNNEDNAENDDNADNHDSDKEAMPPPREPRKKRSSKRRR